VPILELPSKARAVSLKSLKSRWFDAALIGAFALVTTAALARLALDGTLSFAGCFGALLP
jgi:hypothetical protein